MTVTQPQFSLRPSRLTPAGTFPACTSRRVWTHPNPIEIQPIVQSHLDPMTRPQFSLRPSKLTPLGTFPACTSRRIWVHPNPIEIQPGPASFPVFQAAVQSHLDPIQEVESDGGETPPPLILNELISGPIAPLPLSAVITLPTGLLALKRGAVKDKQRPASQLPAFAGIPIEDLPVSSAPVFLSQLLPMGRGVRMAQPKLALRRIPLAAAKQAAAW
jgi:hypothetical protein